MRSDKYGYFRNKEKEDDLDEGINERYPPETSYADHSREEQLEAQAKKFLANPLAFKIDRKADKVYLSSIFQSSWHGDYFISK